MPQRYELAEPNPQGPTSRSYWIVEGRLLAGAYPGEKKVPGETGGRPEVTQQLLDAGVEVFVNLTEDNSDGHMYDPQLDRYDDHVRGQAVIERLSIEDLGLPSVSEMVDILDTVDRHLDRNETVYVHCWGGFGRTGMVIGCWLRRHGYATADTVQGLVDKLHRGAVGGQHNRSPETPDQRRFIVDWMENTDAVRERRKGRADRIVGAVLGSATGDALGAGYEFTHPAPDTPIYMKGGGSFRWEPGEWTDDTQMAVAVLDAAAGGDLDLDGVAANFLAWYRSGPADVGNQTRSVLAATDDPGELLASAAAYLDAHPNNAGNGALMRTSPVALTALGDRELVAERAAAVASLTHPHPDSVAACVLWSLAIEEAITTSGQDGPFDWAAAVRRGLGHVDGDGQDRWATLIDEAVAGPPKQFNPNGWVVTAFQAALAAIVHTPVSEDDPPRHLRDALVAAIRIGDDTDTVAAIAGGLLGARWGASAVPDEWRKFVHGKRRDGAPTVGESDLRGMVLRAVGDPG